MDHPHVARLADVYESEDQLTLVMECMSGGELFNRVQERKRFDEKDASDATHQMLLAINYIHSHGVVHRDLKLENFLYEKKDGDHLKLIDFGFSKVWDPNTKMALSCGTLAYVAPEVLNSNYTSQCDLWSLGVIVFILLVGYMPFCGSESAQVKAIKSGQWLSKPDKWKNISKPAVDFVHALLHVEAAKRLTAKAALEHPFIAERHAMVTADQTIGEDTCLALANFGQASAFRRACMNVMAWSLSNEERTKVRDAFLAMDKDQTGVIKLWEFKKALETQFHLSDEQALAAFKALDANHTDEIHYSEFLAAMCSTRIALHDDLLKMTFKRFDTDNSGFITAANLREVLGESLEGKQVDQIIADVDKSHDGKISYEEFLTYIKNPAQHTDDAHADVAARIIDTRLEKGDSPEHDKRMRALGSTEKANFGMDDVNVEVNEDKSDKRLQQQSKCSCVVL
jgi:Ca2+-binding EF-hand superfamily protein